MTILKHQQEELASNGIKGRAVTMNIMAHQVVTPYSEVHFLHSMTAELSKPVFGEQRVLLI